MEVEEGNVSPTFAANSSRLATFLRPGSEQAHTFKQIYRLVDKRVHNSRLEMVGHQTLAHYNQMYDKNYGQEWAESPKVNIEYLVTMGRFNQNHPKFFR